VLGQIKWEQMVFLGNPEYGVDLMPIDFVKVAEACGGRGVHIEDPRRCREQLAAALRMDGPVVIECVVDANEAPMPPTIKPEQAQHWAEALARGDVNRKAIGVTLFRDVVSELGEPASPAGLVPRIVDKVQETLGIGDGNGKSMAGEKRGSGENV